MQLKKIPKTGRNAPCYCGSGAKYKKCCLRREEEQISKQLEAMRMMEKSECICKSKCESKCACEEKSEKAET